MPVNGNERAKVNTDFRIQTFPMGKWGQILDHETWRQRHCQEVKKKNPLTRFLIYLLKHMEVVLEMERVVSEKTSKITIGHYIY